MLPDLIPKEYYTLGKLGKTFGLKGGLRFYSLGEAEAEAIFTVKEIFITSLGTRNLKGVEAKGAYTVLFISGVEDVSVAKALTNEKIYALSSYLPRSNNLLLQKGFYFNDVIEKPVWVNGTEFGQVTDYLSYGKQNVLVVNYRHIIPIKADYVTCTKEKISIDDPPQGLFELSPK